MRLTLFHYKECNAVFHSDISYAAHCKTEHKRDKLIYQWQIKGEGGQQSWHTPPNVSCKIYKFVSKVLLIQFLVLSVVYYLERGIQPIPIYKPGN